MDEIFEEGDEFNKEAASYHSDRIELSVDKTLKDGKYANLVVSNYNDEEFILDFSFLQPHSNDAEVVSRVVLSPATAKKLCKLLQRNLQQRPDANHFQLGENNPFTNLKFNNN